MKTTRRFNAYDSMHPDRKQYAGWPFAEWVHTMWAVFMSEAHPGHEDGYKTDADQVAFDDWLEKQGNANGGQMELKL